MTAESPNPDVDYRFGSFTLQPCERRLLKGGESVALSARAFDLLVALVQRAGRLVGKEELLDRVWPKLVVEESNLQVHVSALRKILGQDAIATVIGRGYRFALPVEECSAPAPTAPMDRPPNGETPATAFAALAAATPTTPVTPAATLTRV